MIEQTYEARLYAPLFYSSSEGRSVKAEPILSATALMHALGYRYFDLEKRYILRGDAATTADYRHLTELPFFVTDLRPLSAQVDERTFRTSDYRSDRHFTTNDPDIAENVNGKKAVPNILETSGAAWQTIRNYMGITPGANFEFTAWSEEPLPEQPSFRMGIKQTGEFRARETDVDQLVLNKYLLQEVYEIGDELMAKTLEHSSSFRRGNDPRLQHFIDVEPEFVRDELIEVVV